MAPGRTTKKQQVADDRHRAKAVIVVDLQGDFTTHRDGALAVPGTDETYIDRARSVTRHLKEQGLLVVATQDWHPQDHISFATNHPGHEPYQTKDIGGRLQVLWPPHCVQGTQKAELLLEEEARHHVVRKGAHRDFDSYSGFMDDGGRATDLHDYLTSRAVTRLIIYGIATDYCVKATALDARERGYEVTVVAGLSRGVAEETTRRALVEMRSRGVEVVDDIDPLDPP